VAAACARQRGDAGAGVAGAAGSKGQTLSPRTEEELKIACESWQFCRDIRALPMDAVSKMRKDNADKAQAMVTCGVHCVGGCCLVALSCVVLLFVFVVLPVQSVVSYACARVRLRLPRAPSTSTFSCTCESVSSSVSPPHGGARPLHSKTNTLCVVLWRCSHMPLGADAGSLCVGCRQKRRWALAKKVWMR
jgi:hypothetical protein